MGKRMRAVATKRLKVARQSVKRLRFIGKRLRAVATKRPKVARQSVKRLRFIGKRLRAVATKRFWRRIYRETGWIWCGVAIMFVRAKIWHIARSGKLIVVGPWLSEVGFEVLYWIPFLNWVIARYGLDRDRLIVISRGGVRLWYSNICKQHYIDIFDYFTPEEFKVKNLQRINATGLQKHLTISQFDREIVQLVKQTLNVERVALLHPSLMYHLFKFFWGRRSSIKLIEKYTKHQRFQSADMDGFIGKLPPEYVAVKFYRSSCFPDTEQNRSFILSLVRSLVKETPVILLNTGLNIDDHGDFSIEQVEGVYSIEQFTIPQHNLEIQTKIISRARAFFGTYGGLSYLAPFYGVPSVAFYSDEHAFPPSHLDIAGRVFRNLGTSFIALNVRDVNLLRLIFSREVGETLTTDRRAIPEVL